MIDEISINLQLELKGLVAQQYTEIKHEIKSMRDNNHDETIKCIEKEVSYFKRELANTNQLLSNLRKKIQRTSYKEIHFRGNQQRNLMKT